MWPAPGTRPTVAERPRFRAAVTRSGKKRPINFRSATVRIATVAKTAGHEDEIRLFTTKPSQTPGSSPSTLVTSARSGRPHPLASTPESAGYAVCEHVFFGRCPSRFTPRIRTRRLPASPARGWRRSRPRACGHLTVTVTASHSTHRALLTRPCLPPAASLSLASGM